MTMHGSITAAPRLRAIAVLLLAEAVGLAHNSQITSGEEPVVRLNVDLVQVDAIVTDSKGNHITDLKPEEFEISENGKRRPITNFSFIAPDGHSVPAVPAAPRAGPLRLAPGQANRTIAVVVDDLGLSERSFAALRPALEQLVARVGPGDLVAIVTTSGRLGALERLTADKRLLRAAIAKLRSLPNHRPGLEDDDFTCVWFQHRQQPAKAEIQDEEAWLASQRCMPECPKELDPQLELTNDHRSEYYGRLSISALRRVVDGLRELPGRKSILLFSEGVPLVRGQGSGDVNTALNEAYNAFLAHADRSAVAVNTIDPRGLLALSGSVEQGHGGGDYCELARRVELVNTQRQLAEIARRTGGTSIHDDNDLTGAITRVMDDQVGYYLIGFKPGPLEKNGFRKIAIRVARPGVKVRFHSSLYYEPSGSQDSPRDGSRLAAAVSSPFAIPNVRVRISSRFWDAGESTGGVIDTVLQVDARDLTFTTEGDGRRKAVFDMLAVIYGAESKPLDTLDKTYTVSLTAEAFQTALSEGLLQRLELQVKRAGAYQIRGAVRDRQTGRIGSDGEFLEVPLLNRGFALSGISLSNSPGAASLIRYHPGETVYYACQVLNAGPGDDGSRRVDVTAGLYHEGEMLGVSQPVPVEANGQADPKRLVTTGDFRLGKRLQPGDYTLKLTAVDGNAPHGRGTVTQSIDFEVTE